MDTTDPDLHRLALTIGFTRDLIERHAPTQEWEALTHALLEEHTPEQLANMLTGAATIIARIGMTADTSIRHGEKARHNLTHNRGRT